MRNGSPTVMGSLFNQLCLWVWLPASSPGKAVRGPQHHHSAPGTAAEVDWAFTEPPHLLEIRLVL